MCVCCGQHVCQLGIHNTLHLISQSKVFTHYIISCADHFIIQIVCGFVAALLQYLFLCAFCWMLCEGITLYLMLVVVFSRVSKKWWLFLIIGYCKFSNTILSILQECVIHDFTGIGDRKVHLSYYLHELHYKHYQMVVAFQEPCQMPRMCIIQEVIP